MHSSKMLYLMYNDFKMWYIENTLRWNICITTQVDKTNEKFYLLICNFM